MAGAQSIAFPGPGLSRVTASGAVTRVQSKAGTVCSFLTSCAAPAFASNVTAGNLLVACYVWVDTVTTGYGLASVSDTRTSTWSVMANSKQVITATTHETEMGVQCAYTTAAITGGSDTVTCVANTDPRYGYCNVFELTGQNATPWANTSGTHTTGAGTAINAGSYTTLNNGEFGITAIAIDDGIGSPGFLVAGSGWTMDGNTGTGNHEEGDEYQAQAASGALAGAMTAGATGSWTASMVVFTP